MDRDDVDEFLNNIRVQGGGAKFKNQDVDGYGAGGRIGYRKKLDKDSEVEVGVSGTKHSVKAGGRKFADEKITGGDITYRKGDSSYSARYSDSGMPDGKRIDLTYRKAFAKGGVVTKANATVKPANCGASMKPQQKAKK